jgi:hypothetical protein
MLADTSDTANSFDWINQLVDLAGKLTVTVGLIISVWALATGKIIPPSRLEDWKERAKYEQDRGDRLEAALSDSTRKIEANTTALSALKDALLTITGKRE